MLNVICKMATVLMIFGFLVSNANSEPVFLSDTQMDTIAAGGVEKVDGFVCPVIFTDAVTHSPKGMPIGEGHYTIAGPDVMVPEHATNGNGSGKPGGPHSMPGDTDYTAIWKRIAD